MGDVRLLRVALPAEGRIMTPAWLSVTRLMPDDAVALRVPRPPWGQDPFGVVTRVGYAGNPSETIVWVQMDDGTGQQPFLARELGKVDVAAWEQLHAGVWTCACMPGVHRPADQVVCGDCGRARPWR